MIKNKVPYCPRNGTRASCSDPSTWSSFEQAVSAYREGGYDGISMTVYLHRDKIKFWRDFHDTVLPLLNR